MNPDSENFEQLRKLLALKRHEQPPPRYFNDFSNRVIAGIKSDEQSAGGLSWLRKFWSLFETKPMLTGAFGAAVCALVISGVVLSDDPETVSNGVHVAGGDPKTSFGGQTDLLAGNQTLEHSNLSSTNPVSPALRSLLNGIPITDPTLPAGFGFPAGH